MTMLLDGRLRDLATQTHLLEKKVCIVRDYKTKPKETTNE